MHIHIYSHCECSEKRQQFVILVYLFQLIMSNNFFFLLQGDMESPVFALPLLLKTEPHVEKLFTYSFSWNFECSQCGHKYQNRLVFLFFKMDSFY